MPDYKHNGRRKCEQFPQLMNRNHNHFIYNDSNISLDIASLDFFNIELGFGERFNQ